MSNLISPPQLAEKMTDPRLRIVDVRFDLGDPDSGQRAYNESHLPGAVYAHLDRDLSSPVAEHGGRHPLPAIDEVARRLGELGISQQDDVVTYDSGSAMFASRLWWLLRYLGHDSVRVLDGGMAAWVEAGLPLTSDRPTPTEVHFEARVREDMIIAREELLGQLEDPELLLIDARAAERYRGEVEPIDALAGHIPGAVNIPFMDNLRSGRFRSRSELAERYASTRDAREVVTYCGSGVSAAHDILAMEEAGMGLAKLYPGSWSDWSSYEDAPVATGEEF